MRSTPIAYRRKDLSFLYRAGHWVSLCRYVCTCAYRVPSSAALRVARGAGEERPEPGGEKSCKLAVRSAAILYLARGRVSVQRAARTGHVAAMKCSIAGCLLSQAIPPRHEASSANVKQKRRHSSFTCRWMRCSGRGNHDFYVSSHIQHPLHDLENLLKGSMAARARHADLSLSSRDAPRRS